MEQKKTTDMLALLMPNFVQEQIQNGNTFISKDQGFITVMFCDICYFDEKLVQDLKSNIIIFLNDLFRVFDDMCISEGVQKIETVGKTYMAACGLRDVPINDSEYNATEKILNLSLGIMSYIQKEYSTILNGNPLVIKIGINHGKAYSGVIGFHKPQFSLIGDTVNTTSRVCSTGLDGKITMSEKAFEQLTHPQHYIYQTRDVEAKGKGTIQTYVIENQQINTQSYLNPRKKGNSLMKLINYQELNQVGQIRRSFQFIDLQPFKQKILEQKSSLKNDLSRPKQRHSVLGNLSPHFNKRLSVAPDKSSQLLISNFKNNMSKQKSFQNRRVSIDKSFKSIENNEHKEKSSKAMIKPFEIQQVKQKNDLMLTSKLRIELVKKYKLQLIQQEELQKKSKIPIIISDDMDKEEQYIGGEQLKILIRNEEGKQKENSMKEHSNINELIKNDNMHNEQVLYINQEKTIHQYHKKVQIQNQQLTRFMCLFATMYCLLFLLSLKQLINYKYNSL